MALLKIQDYTHKALRSQTTELPGVTDETLALIRDMVETMHEADGVGLAAPQVGILSRLFVYDTGDGPKAVINPVITRATGEELGPEGCLSIPRLQGSVPRATKISVRYLDEKGRTRRETLEGFPARVFQHEYDHLFGILFTDKAVPSSIHMLEEREEEPTLVG